MIVADFSHQLPKESRNSKVLPPHLDQNEKNTAYSAYMGLGGEYFLYFFFMRGKRLALHDFYAHYQDKVGF